MDVNSIPAIATQLAAQRTGDAVGLAVLKKAMETQASGAIALINALPPPVQGLPANLGNHINTTA